MSAPPVQADPPVRSLRSTLLVKLAESRSAWGKSVRRFRSLYWICLCGVIVIPTCLASLKDYIPAFWFAVLSVIVAILGSVQAIVKPFDKFHRDIEFRDEADYFYRLCEATSDPAEVLKIMTDFEQVERRFHMGEHPWAVPKRDSSNEAGQTSDPR
jgi:hypothetical protein